MRDSDLPKVGKFPKVGTSLRAEVLLTLLASDDMTGIESIFEHRKVGLGTVIRALVRKYGWPIERSDFPTNTADGRAAWVSVYSLPQPVIDAALGNGGAAWIEAIRALRTARSRRPLRR